MQSWKLFYDGGCNLCEHSQSRFSRWARSAGFPLETEYLQGPEAVAKGYDGSEMVLEAEGAVLRGPDAALRLLKIAPVPLRWFAWIASFPLTRAFARGCYRLIARFRYTLFGKRACPLPKP